MKSRIVVNLDVSRASHERLIQHIVYDDEEEWSQAELSLLAVGSPTIAYSNLDNVVSRLAA